MKRYEKRTTAREHDVLVEMKCDLCGRASRRFSDGSASDDWEEASGYDIEQVKIEYESGQSYPEGRFTTTESVDMCPDCWRDKLVPWLRAQGATVSERSD